MIYGDKKTGILVQGATGKQGEFHIGLMNAYARQVGGRGVVAGVTPGKAGQTVHDVPVYNTVKDAMKEHDIGASVIFVPAGAAADAIMEEALLAAGGVDTAIDPAALNHYLSFHAVVPAPPTLLAGGREALGARGRASAPTGRLRPARSISTRPSASRYAATTAPSQGVCR